MRLPLVLSIDSRDGAANKDERLTNVLVQKDEEVQLACIRPGLGTISSNSGNGNGLIEMDKVLISVFGTTVGAGPTPTSVGTVLNAAFDFALSPQ